MTTSEAITTLRRKTSLSQRELAEQLGVTITSISRYENGREPSRDVLKRLSGIAAGASLPSLVSFFDKQIRAGIAEKIANLPSAGTQRRVSVSDLQRWAEEQQELGVLVRGLGDALRELPRAMLDRMAREHDISSEVLLRGIAGMGHRLEMIGGEMQIYLRGAIPPRRTLAPEEQSLFRELAELENRKKEKK
ncbi:MAG: helix-turn-helix domain-containing protein [Candidatus Acidiferrales bacterium]